MTIPFCIHIIEQKSSDRLYYSPRRMPNDTRATRRAIIHLSLQFLNLFNLALSWAAGSVDIGPFFGVLINVIGVRFYSNV